MRGFVRYYSLRLLPMCRGTSRGLFYARDGAVGKRIVAQWLVVLLYTVELGGMVLLRCGIFARHPGVPSLQLRSPPGRSNFQARMDLKIYSDLVLAAIGPLHGSAYHWDRTRQCCVEFLIVCNTEGRMGLHYMVHPIPALSLSKPTDFLEFNTSETCLLARP